jgi:hypothetical protein
MRKIYRLKNYMKGRIRFFKYTISKFHHNYILYNKKTEVYCKIHLHFKYKLCVLGICFIPSVHFDIFIIF